MIKYSLLLHSSASPSLSLPAAPQFSQLSHTLSNINIGYPVGNLPLYEIGQLRHDSKSSVSLFQICSLDSRNKVKNNSFLLSPLKLYCLQEYSKKLRQFINFTIKVYNCLAFNILCNYPRYLMLHFLPPKKP